MFEAAIMITGELLLKMFFAGFVLNLFWEFAHCMLYETCRRQSWKQNVPLLLAMSFRDGFWIILFYVISASIFHEVVITNSLPALVLFIVLAVGFSFFDEKISLRLKRWEYAPSMPTIFGVGITPLLEIAVTGILAFLVVF